MVDLLMSLGVTEAVPKAEPDPVSSQSQQIAAALGGDGLAFRKLVEPHLPMLFRLAMRMAGNSQTAEDAVQETLEIAYRDLQRFRPGSSFSAYLASIAVKRARTLRRAEKRRLFRELASQPANSTVDTPEELLRGRKLEARIQQALARMGRKKRHAALLRIDARLSFNEIGQALQMTEGAARTMVHRALAELRKQLEPLISEYDV